MRNECTRYQWSKEASTTLSPRKWPNFVNYCPVRNWTDLKPQKIWGYLTKHKKIWTNVDPCFAHQCLWEGDWGTGRRGGGGGRETPSSNSMLAKLSRDPRPFACEARALSIVPLRPLTISFVVKKTTKWVKQRGKIHRFFSTNTEIRWN